MDLEFNGFIFHFLSSSGAFLVENIIYCAPPGFFLIYMLVNGCLINEQLYVATLDSITTFATNDVAEAFVQAVNHCFFVYLRLWNMALKKFYMIAVFSFISLVSPTRHGTFYHKITCVMQ